MKKIITLTFICLSFYSPFLFAQDKGKLQLDIEAPIKFSNGKSTIQTFHYKGIETLNYPKFALYRNPVYGINLNILYGLTESFKIGIGSGMNGEFFESSPVYSAEYYNRLMIPVYAKVMYQKVLSERMVFVTCLNAGYQYFDNRIANDSNGFFFRDKGGFLGGLDLGAGYRTSKFLFSVKLGYELNIFSHTYRLDYGSHPAGITKENVIDFNTFYRLIRLTFGVNIF